MKTETAKVFYKLLNSLTNHQRNLWAKSGYPGLVHKESDKLTKWIYDQEHQNDDGSTAKRTLD